MNSLRNCIVAGVGLLAAVALIALPAEAKTSKPPAKTTAPVTNAPPATTIVEIPQSVFAIPATDKEGRNPFFPHSTTTPPPPPPDRKDGKGGPGRDVSGQLVLKGITSPPKRTAIINNRTFEAGESAEVKLAGGSKVLIKCLEIRADSAIVLVNGAERELRMRMGL